MRQEERTRLRTCESVGVHEAEHLSETGRTGEAHEADTCETDEVHEAAPVSMAKRPRLSTCETC